MNSLAPECRHMRSVNDKIVNLCSENSAFLIVFKIGVFFICKDQAAQVLLVLNAEHDYVTFGIRIELDNY